MYRLQFNECTKHKFRRLGKIVDFRHLSHRISETVQDRVQVAIDH